MRARLVARERLLELTREAHHRAPIRLLAHVTGDVQLKRPDEHVGRSFVLERLQDVET